MLLGLAGIVTKFLTFLHLGVLKFGSVVAQGEIVTNQCTSSALIFLARLRSAHWYSDALLLSLPSPRNVIKTFECTEITSGIACCQTHASREREREGVCWFPSAAASSSGWGRSKVTWAGQSESRAWKWIFLNDFGMTLNKIKRSKDFWTCYHKNVEIK